ncbi:hypothetical protein [Caballeronia sp. LZ032]|uniref:hypothetical protein n=1 Tax=Caballeronia sp. LZ032 TaxID=3038565 RepID=UPI00285AE334|nr:hypothetical protein [Caballeronia sp. LZ032]MDR5882635.1 hypothetical protein [Caballeronia sp. LZ032]
MTFPLRNARHNEDFLALRMSIGRLNASSRRANDIEMIATKGDLEFAPLWRISNETALFRFCLGYRRQWVRTARNF